jgi:hypothetical protein
MISSQNIQRKMKMVHISSDTDFRLQYYPDLMYAAKEQEIAGNLKTAEKLYLKGIKLKPGAEYSYNRLMIMYRKQKDLLNERRFILDSIKVFEAFYNKKKATTNTVLKLSWAISKFTGLTDKKGKNVYDHQPIKKWKMRLQTINKKMGKKLG